MATERDFELLDDYIGNRLTATEKAAFEQKLAGDPALKQEYGLQQKIADGIRKARTQELKSLLNNIPVPPAGTAETSALTKVATWAAVTGLVVAGVFVYLKNSGPEENNITQQQQPPASTEVQPGETPAEPQQEPSLTPQEKPSNTTEKARKEEPEAIEEKNTAEEEKPNQPVLDVFDPSEETEDNASAPEPKASLDNKARISTTPTITVETDNSNRKYTFHYQFKDGKLFLYGSFEKNLYEIMEFFTENKRTIFLFYKNNYYLLSEDNEKIKPLAPINDPALLKKLKEYRAGNGH